MIRHDGKKVTAKQKASLVWDDHFYGQCAWAEWIDADDVEKMSPKQLDDVLEQMDKLRLRMLKMLKKARGEK